MMKPGDLVTSVRHLVIVSEGKDFGVMVDAPAGERSLKRMGILVAYPTQETVLVLIGVRIYLSSRGFWYAYVVNELV